MSEHTDTPRPDTAQWADRADIRQLRRQAKELLRDAVAGDGAATARLAAIDAAGPPKLADAQLAVARESNFASWPQLRRAVADQNATTDSPVLPSGPIFRTKYRTEEAVVTPNTFLDGAAAAGWEPGPLPDAIVFVFHGIYAQLLDDDPRFERNTLLAPSNSTMFTSVSDGTRIGVTCLSPGAGAMIGQVEHQVALGGADRFGILGSAGSITTDVPVGDVIAVTSAVRDDGISQHYLPPDTYVDANADLTERIVAALVEREVTARAGTTWTLPTPYRSTADEVEHFAADGVSVVECEVASLLAVAEALGVAASACLAVTSSLVDEGDAMRVRPPTPAVLLDAVIDALS